MHPLEATASRAPVEMCHVLEGLAGHLPVSLLHVRRLLLGHGAQDALPDVLEQRWYRREERDGGGGDGEAEGGDTEPLCPEGLEEGRGVEEPEGGGGGRSHGGHFEDIGIGVCIGLVGWLLGIDRGIRDGWKKRFRICAKRNIRVVARDMFGPFGVVACPSCWCIVPSLCSNSQNPAVAVKVQCWSPGGRIAKSGSVVGVRSDKRCLCRGRKSRLATARDGTS